MATVVVAIAGGSGSGKSTLCDKLRDQAVVLSLDSFYKDSGASVESKSSTDFDRPDALDFDLVVQVLKELVSRGESDKLPSYDFKTHSRDAKRRKISVGGKKVVVVEGILALHSLEIREMAHLKVFVDAPPDVRALRRLARDVRERGRTTECATAQWLSTVRKNHIKYVEPSRKFADLVVPGDRDNGIAVEVLKAWLRGAL